MYIRVAESLDQGQLHEDKYNRFGLNSFPVILMLLHRLGLDWELAGKLWNVAISCLTVLPLYGWVRRQFDDRVALRRLPYALHSEFIRSSPEGIRDPTFWFFMSWRLYWLWRAVGEVRLRFFLFGGLALALAVITRSEGFFSCCRCCSGRPSAGGKVAGTLRVPSARSSWLLKKPAAGTAGRTAHGVCLLISLRT